MESSSVSKDEKVKDSEGQPHKQKRRTRNDPNNRNFTCGCGKAYLSYPALYTHLKQKHDGKAPEGTNLPQSSSKGIRGRPKVNKEDPGLQEKEEEEEEEENTETSTEEENTLNEFLYYLANLSKVFIQQDGEKPISLVLECESDNMNILNNFPQEIFMNSQDYLGILIYLKELLHNNGIIQEDTNEDNQLKKTICDKVFAIFLYKIAKHVSADCFKELCVFICLFRKTLNMRGWELKKTILMANNENKEKIQCLENESVPFCEMNTAEFALEISNEFIIDYFPRFLKEVKTEGFKVLGEEEEKLKNVVYLTQHFCNWLFNNYYTNSRLSLNLD